MSLPGGCARFWATQYAQAVPDARGIIAAREKNEPAPVDPVQREFYTNLTLSDRSLLELAGCSPADVPVFWLHDARRGFLDYECEIIGDVTGEVWTPLMLFDRPIAESYFRQAARAAGADAVLRAGGGAMYPSLVGPSVLYKPGLPDDAPVYSQPPISIGLPSVVRNLPTNGKPMTDAARGARSTDPPGCFRLDQVDRQSSLAG